MVGRRKKVPKGEKLSDDDKRKLATAIQSHPCLWKLSDPDHRRHDAQMAAWNVISTALDKPVNLCKEGWKSLKDGLRYQAAPKKKQGKSGDSAVDINDEDDDWSADVDEEQLQGWKFYEEMKFIMEERPKRRTTQAMNIDVPIMPVDDVPFTQDVVINPDMPASNRNPENEENVIPTPKSSKELESKTRNLSSSSHYDYEPKKSRKSVEDKTSDDRLMESIQSIVDIRKASLVLSQPPPIDAKPHSLDLKYYSMFVNMDRMMQKLPEDVVEDLNYKFIGLIREEMKKLVLDVNK